MASENTVQKQIWLALGRVSCLFRLNTGRAWLSNNGPSGVKRLNDGSVLITNARSIALGLATPSGETVTGACDLPGWTSVTITPEMVGSKVAVFTSIECKKSKGGKLSPEQANWMEQVKKAGGIAGLASSADDALLIIDEWYKKIM